MGAVLVRHAAAVERAMTPEQAKDVLAAVNACLVALNVIIWSAVLVAWLIIKSEKRNP